MSVYDRWWKTQRQADGSVRRVPSADYGCAKRWQVRWRDESGRQRKRNFSKRDGKNPERDASAFDAKMKAALDAGTALDLAAGKMLVRDYAALYRRDLLHRNSTGPRIPSARRPTAPRAAPDGSTAAEPSASVGEGPLSGASAIESWGGLVELDLDVQRGCHRSDYRGLTVRRG